RSQLDPGTLDDSDGQIGICIQSRERRVAGRVVVRITVEAESHFVAQIWREGMVLASRDDLEALRYDRPKSRNLPEDIGAVPLFITETNSELVLVRDIPVHGVYGGEIVVVVAPREAHVSYRNCRVGA